MWSVSIFSYSLAAYSMEARLTDATGTNWSLPRLCALRLIDDHSGNMMVEQLGIPPSQGWEESSQGFQCYKQNSLSLLWSHLHFGGINQVQCVRAEELGCGVSPMECPLCH